MNVTAPPKPRLPPPGDTVTDDAQEALIEEARRRARRRRCIYGGAAAAGILGLAFGLFVGFGQGNGGGPSHAPGTNSPPRRSAPAPPTAQNGKIAFFSDGYLEVINPDGSDLHALAGSNLPGEACVYDRCDISAYAWAPDGTRIAFFRGDPGAGPGCATNCRPPKFSLFVVDANGGNERMLSHCAGDCGGANGLAWSPDSSKIAFSPYGLSILDTRSGRTRPLDTTGTNPAWSPDGTSIAYTLAGGLFIITATGGQPKRLTAVPFVDEQTPSWAPDNRRIAFGAEDGLYTARVDGTQLTELVSGSLGSGPGAPTWSPDGAHILYFSTPGGTGSYRSEVWETNVSGSKRVRLRGLPCCVGEWFRPIWSPDGTQIAWAADSNAAGGTFVMHADGTGLRRLLRLPAAITWQAVR